MKRLLSLTWSEWFLLLEATLWLGLARAAVLTLPFRWLMRQLARPVRPPEPTLAGPETVEQQRQIAWALAVVSRRTPWWSNCLAQGLAGMIMLRRRKIPSTLYLGVGKTGEDQFNAHAWLRSDSQILTGDGPLERYAVIASFTSAAPGQLSSSSD